MEMDRVQRYVNGSATLARRDGSRFISNRKTIRPNLSSVPRTTGCEREHRRIGIRARPAADLITIV